MVDAFLKIIWKWGEGVEGAENYFKEEEVWLNRLGGSNLKEGKRVNRDRQRKRERESDKR